MDFEIHRYIDKASVRSFCIEDKLYTKGSNMDYCKMFGLCDLCCGSGYTDQTIIDIAKDIWEHTDTDALAEGYTVETVIWKLLNRATVAYVCRKEAPL